MKNKNNSKLIRWPLILKTKRLILRPYLPTDFKEWVAGFRGRKPAQHEFDSGPVPLSLLTRTRYNEMCRRHSAGAARDSGYMWGVFDKKNGKILGWVDIYVFIRGSTQAANFGYLIHNQYWRQGYGREAAYAVAVAAFKHLKLQRLEASIAPQNRASIKLIRALGFRFEGRRPGGDWRGGKWQEDRVYSATPADFGLAPKAPRVRRGY